MTFTQKISVWLLCGLLISAPVFADSGVQIESMQTTAAKGQFCLALSGDEQDPAPTAKTVEKSVPKNTIFFKSMVLPGWGQYSAGRKGRALSYVLIEASLWGSFAGCHFLENQTVEDYQTFAATHALVLQPADKSHRYLVNIGNYADVYSYNAAKLQQRSLDEVYAEDSNYFWQWDNLDNQQKFEDMRIRGDNYGYASQFIVGAIVANHLISAIDAIWVAHKINRQHELSQLENRVRLTALADRQSWKMVLSKSF
ncbi:hypothetical protein KAH55_02335 [bacterium]|nr:hypothetical protein [bacterium]